MKLEIQLSDIYSIHQPWNYKVHLASRNDEGHQPLDVFVRSRAEWEWWNRYRGARDDFNRDLIFSMIDFYPQQGRWLFAGVYRIIGRRSVNHDYSYDVELLPACLPFVGRLKIQFTRPGRAKAVNLETYLPEFTVCEILAEP